ncbi:MAG: DUF3379 family protein [Gammaproteobacteria bacterium]
MMDHAQFRRAMLGDPNDPDPKLRAHREDCRECTVYAERLLRFESRLDRALRVKLPGRGDWVAPEHSAGSTDADGSDGVVPFPAKRSLRSSRSTTYRRGWLAMAASVLVAVLVAGVLWVGAPGASIAADVVTHMAAEPGAWLKTDRPVPDVELQKVLRNTHLRLATGSAVISYASSCKFRGHHVPHLVIQTESGPVTVMVLVHEHESKPVQFDEQGYRGVIVPVPGHGSIAVLTHAATTDIKTVEGIAARVVDSIVWTG